MNRLEGYAAVVTGGARGIGKAIASFLPKKAQKAQSRTSWMRKAEIRFERSW
mgnify:CR=1 FL=1